MKAIAISDVHLGWGEEEGEAFRDFLDEIPDYKLDYFLILGDFFEFWRRSVPGPLLQFSDILSKLVALGKKTMLILLAGNHDWSFITMGHPEYYPYPFNFREFFTIRMDDFYFSFSHGHQFDPQCKHDRQNNAICHSNDEQGEKMSSTWERRGKAAIQTYSRPLKTGVDPARPYIPMHAISLLAYVQHPGLPSRVPSVLEIIRENARRSKRPNEFVVHGHTHRKYLNIDEMYCDTGCWVEGHTDYLLIEDDEISLEVY